MSNILQRALTGAIFVFLVLAALWSGTYATVTLFGIFAVIALYEFYQLFNQHDSVRVNWKIATFIGLLVFIILSSTFLGWINLIYVFFLIPVLFLNMLIELWKKEKEPIYNIAVQMLGIIYVVIPFYLMIELNQQSTHDMPRAIGMFLLIWTNDTFAYLTGRFFGKTKLFERISPNKTWEGTIGGGLLTMLVAILLAFFYNDIQDLIFWVGAALIVVPCAVLGDLLESLFKRNLNIKDSGKFLPGHGGILDRFDAVIFTVPFYFCWSLFHSWYAGELFIF
ncbi:phosphatidate cytidylyltransferase [Crocinitomicaceae bacterium]|jgi:phosphatidate cytidylyltransferase|nr:phosphatidate cytidylyltransferase [Crocinitomicaceae bacterium]